LLLIDDNKDSDATNTHGKTTQTVVKPILKIGTPEFNKVSEFIAKGGEMSKVKLKYELPLNVEKALKF